MFAWPAIMHGSVCGSSAKLGTVSKQVACMHARGELLPLSEKI